MSNLDNDHVYQEEMDNLYMRHMMHRYMQYCGEKLLEEEMSLLDTTERHPTKAQYRRMKRDLQRIARKSNSHAIRVPRRFVPQVVILIALLAVSLIVAGAYKINAFGFLSAQTPQYTEYGSRTIGRACSFSYIPDGLTERSYEVSADAVRIIYTDNENINRYFQLFITKDSRSIYVDTENADYIETLTINGMSGELSSKMGIISIAWVDSDTGFTYVLRSTLDEEQTIKIVEGIHKST